MGSGTSGCLGTGTLDSWERKAQRSGGAWCLPIGKVVRASLNSVSVGPESGVRTRTQTLVAQPTLARGTTVGRCVGR
ncbi:uncharacterized protein CTRU02_202217 [Colletotrichum truncatum]|uniref:Uncharacterized protein n=1 Tax=Colletotrichum truncatum TaxID=5467 RepID=A0ACC3ZJP6_COLTU|nr:uncharacterized protein CTRU02_01378 [Colletotrichum truncatum]KAF6799699.1 hypothetical protein CTRU02_01378 [Colletotrichum truncatum]